MTFGGRRLSVEEDLRWKTTFDGRWPLMEDFLWWKTTFDRIQPLTEDDLWWKTTFGGKMTFGGRPPSLVDNSLWKTTFKGRLRIDRFWDSALSYTIVAVIFHVWSTFAENSIKTIFGTLLLKKNNNFWYPLPQFPYWVTFFLKAPWNYCKCKFVGEFLVGIARV